VIGTVGGKHSQWGADSRIYRHQLDSGVSGDGHDDHLQACCTCGRRPLLLALLPGTPPPARLPRQVVYESRREFDRSRARVARNGATGVSLTPVLNWNAATGAGSYDMYIGTSASPGLIGSLTVLP
jgi:hypothetical protein